ncbi:response regulator [bacterium]|nr:MAG: response regulator [bacterium]
MTDAITYVGKRSLASEKTVLLVDDDEDILTLLEVLVHRDGFKILMAEDGETALTKMKEKPDGMVLDLYMPGTDGFRVLESLETLPIAPPVIVITGSPNQSDIEKVSRSPLVKAVLKKPIRQNDLLAALHKALNTVADPPKPKKVEE